jgi:hypothetical protein
LRPSGFVFITFFLKIHGVVMKLPKGALSVVVALVVGAIGLQARADVFSSTATTDAAVYGGATPGVESAVTLDLRTDTAGATGGATGRIGYIQFSDSAPNTAKTGAQLDLFVKRNNSGIAYNLYGVNDSSASATPWTSADISASTTAITAPGTLAALDANGNPAIDPAQTTLLGSITGLPTLTNSYLDLAITDTGVTLNGAAAGTFTAGDETLSQFLSSDTHGYVTFLLVPTARGSFLSNTFTASGGVNDEKLTFSTSAAAVAPEPASLSLLALGGAVLATRRRSGNGNQAK